MTDNSYSHSNEQLLYLTDDQLKQGIEALFFANKKIISKVDPILAKYGYGRAHYRAIFMIGSRPDINITQLTTVLSVSKQSVNRVLRRLKSDGIVRARRAEFDKRVYRLRLTASGERLAEELSTVQRQVMREAYMRAGPSAVSGFRTVTEHLIESAYPYGWPISTFKQ